MVTAVHRMNHFLSRLAPNERFTFAQVRYIGKAGTVYRIICEKIKSGELIRIAWGVYVRATEDFVEPAPFEVAQTKAGRFGHSIGEIQTKSSVNSDSPCYEFTTDGRATSFMMFSGGKPCRVIRLKERSTPRTKATNGADKCKNRQIEGADQSHLADGAAEPKGITISFEESENEVHPIPIVSNFSVQKSVASPVFPIEWLLLTAWNWLHRFLPAELRILQRMGSVDFGRCTEFDLVKMVTACQSKARFPKLSLSREVPPIRPP